VNLTTQLTRSTARTATFAATAALVLLATYWPGLTGPFLFDDRWNLAPLGTGGGIASFGDWLRFVFGGGAGPLGRPVSLASFTLNAQDWPADPWPFKLTNLLIHISNALLLYVLTRKLLQLSRFSYASALSGAVALLWALHPLHTSTVLYVVQRMTQLSLLFTLLGLILFVHGRILATSRPYAGYLLMASGIGGGTLLATFSKENGALLPLYALVLEVSVLKHASISTPIMWRHGAAVFLRLPLLALAGYFSYNASTWLSQYLRRDFSPMQRLGAEGPILLDYLKSFGLPRLSGSGLFHEVTVADFQGPTMVAAWVVISVLLATAWWLRARAPMVAAGLLWFFAGHVMESTFLPLELYFEHRNYLPYVGLVWALIATLAKLPPRVIAVTSGLLLILWGAMTHLQARTWGNEQIAAQVWLQEQPDSLRATQFAAGVLQANGSFEASRALIHNYVARHPNHPMALLQKIELDCITGASVTEPVHHVTSLLGQKPFSHAMPQTFNQLLVLANNDRCDGLNHLSFHRMLEAALSNPQVLSLPKAEGQMLITQGSALAQQGHWALAIGIAARAGKINQQINAPYWQSLWSLEAGRCDAAGQYLNAARELASKGLYTNDPPPEYLDALQQAILGAMASGACTQ